MIMIKIRITWIKEQTECEFLSKQKYKENLPEDTHDHHGHSVLPQIHG